MHHIEIPLLTFKVRLRPLTWREAFAIKPKAKVDPITLTLATAMVDVVSGTTILPITPAKALELIASLPPAIRSRAWLVYQGSVPENRIFTTRNLYESPAAAAYNRRVALDEEEQESTSDALTRQMEAKFGVADMREASALDAKFIANARGKNQLVRATEPSPETREDA